MSCNLNSDIQSITWAPYQYKENFIKDYLSPIGMGSTTAQIYDILNNKNFILTDENKYDLENNFLKVIGIENINLTGTSISKVSEAKTWWETIWTKLMTPNSKIKFLRLYDLRSLPFCREDGGINPINIHDPQTAIFDKITKTLEETDVIVLTDYFFSSILFCYKIPNWYNNNAFFWLGLQGDSRVWDDRLPYDTTTRFNTLRWNSTKCVPEFHYSAVLSGYVEWGIYYPRSYDSEGSYPYFKNTRVAYTDTNSWDTDNSNTQQTIIVQFKYDTVNRNTFFTDFFKTSHLAVPKWQALCCYTIPKLQTQDSSFPVITYSNNTDYRQVAGMPTPTCDNFMFGKYCVTYPSSPVCGCSELNLNADQKRLKQVLLNQGLVSDIKCLSSKCNNDVAYQSFNIKNTICANKCIGIINEEVGSFGKLNVDGMTMTLSCDSNGNILTQSKCFPECKDSESCVNNICNGCNSNSDCLNGKSCLAGYCVGAENPLDVKKSSSINVYVLIGIVIFGIIVSIVLGYFLSKAIK